MNVKIQIHLINKTRIFLEFLKTMSKCTFFSILNIIFSAYFNILSAL